MTRELSVAAKQTFQIVALVATILVVGIHYQSAAPATPSPEAATWNELTQEFLLGGIARVAVPMFAFAAGLFYFRSDDGTWRSYLRKLKSRGRSVLIPYFIIASVAITSWLVVRRIEGNPVQLGLVEFLATWLLRPPAEQLWFLRDLMVLVAIAPIIGRLVKWNSACCLSAIGIAWMANWQPFPVVAGWHLLHIETLLFFSLGAAAVDRGDWIERLAQSRWPAAIGLVLVWCDLIVTRIFVRADFDAWYLHDYDAASLVLHKFSIVAGCVALFAICGKLRHDHLIRCSGAAFFVYLVHEFPLRAAVERVAQSTMDKPNWFWLTAPAAIILCFTAAILLNRLAPPVIAFLTGGRTPDSAQNIASRVVQKSEPAAAGQNNVRNLQETGQAGSRRT